MKFLHVILTISFLLLVPLLVVESSSSSDKNLVSNITRGSSISSNDTRPYWLSPSGNIAFGFYTLPNSADRYVVGIWFARSSQKTLVWTANPNDLPMTKPSSILFTDEGTLVLLIIPDNKNKLLLPDVSGPASFAKMHDDGNFVLYNSYSQIVWESFDYATDTILGGQKLRPGNYLISGDYKLSVKQTNGYVAIYEKFYPYLYYYGDTIMAERLYETVSYSLEDSLSRPVILSLDVTGKLYLASSGDEVVEVFYPNKKQKQQVNEDEGDYIYRATLTSTGRFSLHKDRVDGNDSHDHHQKSSSIVWSTNEKVTTSDGVTLTPTRMMSVLMGVTLSLALLIIT